MGDVVEIAGLVKEFESGDATLRVLDGVDFSLGAGEPVSVVGASGCGKSTLLNIVGTLDVASAGQVKLFGEDVAGMGEKARASLRAKNVGFVFQMHHLLPQCSVLENVMVPTLALGRGEGGDVERAKRLLERVGLGSRMGHVPSKLSGGERQRTALVRALINRPKLLLADEPTGALDEANASELAVLLKELNAEEGLAMMVVTHDRKLAGEVGKVLELKGGTLEEAGG